jgi:hypothetical protein
MKKELVLYFALLVLPIDLIAQYIQLITPGSPNSTSVMGGEYKVANNVWGTGAGVGSQTLEVDPNGTYWKVILSTHNSASVASYPFIWKGNHWGSATTTNNPMPKMLKEIDTAPFTWVVDTAGVAGTWDAAFESWFDDVPASTSYVGELMIWINYGGGASPAGGRVATVDIGGYSWDVYFYLMGSPAWNYIAYKITTPVTSVSVDLKDFMHDALTRGYLKTDWYLANMEAGFEIWRDGQGLTTQSFSADVTDGNSLDENYAPAPFMLSTPTNGKTLASMVIPFTWQNSVDANSDAVDYIFHLVGPNVDTTVTVFEDDSLLFDGNGCLQLNTTYTWYVEATDGFDTTESTTRRTVKTPRFTGIYSTDQVPRLLSLDQNYPNPFNPRTMISYSLPHTSFVTLKVYDLMGREIATLVQNERKAQGNYEISFDASNLSSGVYFYKLQTEKFTQTKQMVLTK